MELVFYLNWLIIRNLYIPLPNNRNKQNMRHQLLTCLLTALTLLACSEKKSVEQTRIIFKTGAYPFATEYKGTYYYTMQTEMVDTIMLWSTDDLRKLNGEKGKVVLTSTSNDLKNFWSPELHRIGDKWYIYFEGDDGNTDNHQIYCIENQSDDPMKGEWKQRGPIITNTDWNFGIHPTSVVVDGRQYLLWSGWEKRRIETETQCIFIAEMENPWTLKSKRILISRPEYEWERQWITANGLRSAYPIFVNENPEAFLSPDGKKVIVAYSASGIWTTYNSLGLLYADTRSNLLDPHSWTKISEPQFVADSTSGLFGTSNISMVQSTDRTKTYMLYEAKHEENGYIPRDIRLKEITWDKNGLPVFGEP